jgi:hypothetical protein
MQNGRVQIVIAADDWDVSPILRRALVARVTIGPFFLDSHSEFLKEI